MTDVFNETLRSWHNYYFMTGGASATLVGLMFVALSLGMHLVNDDTRQNIHTFVTPSIVYFVSALLICCIMIAPNYMPSALAVILLIVGIIGLAVSTPFFWRLIQAARVNGDFNLWDWLSQVILPPIAYGLLITAGVCFLTDQWALAFLGVWLVVILLLICAISNTWSMVMWIINQRGSET
jgi:hypothetical protein